MAKDSKTPVRQQLYALWNVWLLTWRTAPGSVLVQLVRALFDAITPIITTYFAAMTTTELVKVVQGVDGAVGLTILYATITVILGVISAVIVSLQQYLNTLMRFRVQEAVVNKLYNHFLHLDFYHYDLKETRDTYDKATRFATFLPYMSSQASGLVSQVISAIASLVALSAVEWWLGLIVLAAMLPSLILQFRLSRATNKHWSENVDLRRAAYSIENDGFHPRYMAELRLYGVAQHLLDLRSRLREKDEGQRIAIERNTIFGNIGSDILQAVVELGILVWTIWRIAGHYLPIGQFIYIQQITSRALGSASGIASAVSDLDENFSSLVEYNKFMDIPESNSGTRGLEKMPETIKFEKVSFSYPQSDKLVLDDINLEIKRGQHIAIVGENGAGKSTFIKLLTGLYRPSIGSLTLDGVSLGDFDVTSWHKYISDLQQNFVTYWFATVRDNIYYGDVSHKFDQARFDRAVNMAEAGDFIDKMPKGENSYIASWMGEKEEAGTELSGGQYQRIALARNFYRNSDFIILDEPTSAIDALAEGRIYKHLLDEKDKTVVTISHRLSTVKRADVIYMFEDGRIVEHGTYAELIKKQGHFYKLFESQL